MSKVSDIRDDSEGMAAWLWSKFLASDSEVEMAELAKEDESIEKAHMILVKLSEDEQARYQAEREEEQRRVWESIMEGALEEGREEGRVEGKREAAASMKAYGMEVALIEKITGLSRDELERL